MRVHDKFYPQAETPSRKVYDEQCAGKFYYFTGEYIFLDLLHQQLHF